MNKEHLILHIQRILKEEAEAVLLESKVGVANLIRFIRRPRATARMFSKDLTDALKRVKSLFSDPKNIKFLSETEYDDLFNFLSNQSELIQKEITLDVTGRRTKGLRTLLSQTNAALEFLTTQRRKSLGRGATTAQPFIPSNLVGQSAAATPTLTQMFPWLTGGAAAGSIFYTANAVSTSVESGRAVSPAVARQVAKKPEETKKAIVIASTLNDALTRDQKIKQARGKGDKNLSTEEKNMMTMLGRFFNDDGSPKLGQRGYFRMFLLQPTNPKALVAGGGGGNLPLADKVKALPETSAVKMKMRNAAVVTSAWLLTPKFDGKTEKANVTANIKEWERYFQRCGVLDRNSNWTMGVSKNISFNKPRKKSSIKRSGVLTKTAIKAVDKIAKNAEKAEPEKAKNIKLVEPEGPACGAPDGVACFIDAYVTVYDTIVRRMKRVAKSKGEDASDVMDRMQDVMPYLHQSSNQVSFSGENYAVSKEVESGYAGSAQALMAAIFGELLDLREYRRARVAAYYGETTSDEIRQIIDKSTKEYLGMVLTQNGLKKLEKKIAEKLPRKPDPAQELDAGTSNSNPTTRVVESKSYNIDFSKWKPMIKNSY